MQDGGMQALHGGDHYKKLKYQKYRYSSCAILVLYICAILYSCSPPCRDVLEIYSGVPAMIRKRVCRSTGVSEVTLQNRFATVMFASDAIQGTGRGFTGTFSSYGLCPIVAIIFCACHRFLI